ncbi:MAG: DUF3168 domain-containing protein [Deltaproteobacteria bacterium]
MTFGEALYGLLSADDQVAAMVRANGLVKIFPDVAPQGVAQPFVVYHVVDDASIQTLEGASASLAQARIQVDCYAKAYASAQELARRVAAVLSRYTTASLTCARLSGHDAYDDEAMLHRVVADFSMWKRSDL